MTKQDAICLVKSVTIWGTVLLLCWAFFGCKTQLVTVPEIHTEYVHDTLHTRDSIHIYTSVYIKGDTVYHDSIVYVDRWRDKTVETIQRDSIPYPVEVEKIVTVRSGYDRFCSWAFWIIVALVLLYVAWWAFKTFYLRK